MRLLEEGEVSMLSGLLLGIAIAASTAPPPPAEPSQVPKRRMVFTYDLSTVALPPPAAEPLRGATLAGTSIPKPHSKLDRIIAVAAGTSLGFVLGGTIGGHLTENRRNPDDDTSALRGIMIGAPIGAVLGGLTGYWLTK
jgi:hypothetical protein